MTKKEKALDVSVSNEKEINSLAEAKEAFEKSIDVARRAGVPEEKILKTKEDIDSYFS